MSDPRSVLERESRRFPQPDGAFERLVRRRDRKRRNQRIAAGVVGIAVFVASIWVVTTGPFDTSPTPAAPGPTETGPTVTDPSGAPDDGGDGYSYPIPPEGTALSTPVEGELVATGSPFRGYTRVYADGRVISCSDCSGSGRLAPVVEQRLSPEGVELVRSQAVGPYQLDLTSLPASAWEEREGKPYVPARYAACFWVSGSLPDEEVDVLPRLLNLLPVSAQALLRGGDPAGDPGCLQVTPEETRTLDEILSEAGLTPRTTHFSHTVVVGAWLLRESEGDELGISLRPLFPDGHALDKPPG